jgi:anti-anti-sigma regulatory factor
MKADAIVFALSGEIDTEHTERLQELLDIEKHSRILLDLTDVTLVGRAAVQFLARAEEARIRMVNCPDYVRTWIVTENRETQPPQRRGQNQLGNI